jgi:predicted permease
MRDRWALRRWWRRRESRENDLDRELLAHLELEAEEQQDAGLPPEEARNAARRAFGNVTFVKEEVRDVWGWTAVEQIAQDMRYALRGIRTAPAFAAVVVASLALGMGATTAVFSVLNAVVLRPLAAEEPERLVILQPQLRGKRFVFFNPFFEEVRAGQQSLAGMVAISDEPYLKVAFDREEPIFVRGSLVSGTYFQMFGLSPALGRLLTPGDDEPSAGTCAAVLSYAYWTAAMHSDPAVLGRTVSVREKICAIVGVAPASFRSHEPAYSPDLWVPVRSVTDPKLLASRSMAFFSGVMGRLRSGTTISQAEAELTGLFQRLQPTGQLSPHPGEAPPKPTDFRILVLPGKQGLDRVRSRLGQPVALAFAVAGVVLLIAAFNVANLLLARGAARNTELATRAALGAGRVRLMRLLATEGAVLSVVGGLVGVLLAVLFTPALSRLLPLAATSSLDTRPDARVIAAAAAATIFAALLAGVLPALRLSRQDLYSGMAAAGRTTGARSGQRITRTLVVAQLALSLLLVASAGLLFRSIVRLMAIDPGFNTSRVMLMDISDTEPAAKFGEVDTNEQKARRAAAYRELDDRLNAIPGVEAASLSWLGLFSSSYVGLNVYDVDLSENSRFTLTDYVSSRYFEAVGMQLVRGRGFTQADREGSLRAIVVNEAYVRERVPANHDSLGRRLVMTYADDRRPWTIVGVVRDARYNDLRQSKAEPMIWVPLAQAPFKMSSISLKLAPGVESTAVREVRSALAAVNRYLMVRNVTTLRAQVDRSAERERMLLKLASGFGGIALLLAAVGLYGTLAYAVARRTREIGVRLTLGAQRSSVLRLIFGECLMLVFAGILIGAPLSLAAGYALRGFLFGVSPYDIATLAAAGAVLGTAALVAAFVPALRASRVDPIVALKWE